MFEIRDAAKGVWVTATELGVAIQTAEELKKQNSVEFYVFELRQVYDTEIPKDDLT